jgi:hypothetical protein
MINTWQQICNCLNIVFLVWNAVHVIVSFSIFLGNKFTPH